MIPRKVLNNVVPIGFRGAPGMGSPIGTIWVGTGFLVKEIRENATRFYLITNRHVIQGQNTIIIRVADGPNASSYSDVPVLLVDINGYRLSSHPNPNVDIVAVSIEGRLLKSNELGFNIVDESITIDQMKQKGVGEGDAVYALGYPMGIVDMHHSYPICRMGCIASISSAYDGLNPIDYIVDSQTFPGNSGGPIILKCDGVERMGAGEKLIGILRANITYTEVLVSQQTQRSRSTMEENSGLTIVHPMDRIIDVIKLESSRIDMLTCNKSSNL